MEIHIPENQLITAARESTDAFLATVITAIREAIGGELNAETMSMLTGEQTVLLGYDIFREEVMDGGFIQLIQNGYAPFFFDNPFAKAMRLWGLHDFSKLIYKAKKYYDAQAEELSRERTDEEFMALFEQHPEFDDLDNDFIEAEEELTEAIARYVDEHLELFVVVDKT